MKDAIALIEILEKQIEDDNYNEILSLFQKVKIIIQANERNQDTLIQNGLIDVCCSFLSTCISSPIKESESITCLEIVSWITINITAGYHNNETKICTNNGMVEYYVEIILKNQCITSEMIENVLFFFKSQIIKKK